MERRDGKAPTHPKADEVERTRLVNAVWDMRDEQYTFLEIAEFLGISQTTARKYFRIGLLANMPAAAEGERALMVRQIDTAMKRIRIMMTQTNDISERVKLETMNERYMRRKATLLGLDAAQKFDVRHTKRSELDEEIEGLSEEMGQSARDAERLDRLETRRKGFRAR